MVYDVCYVIAQDEFIHEVGKEIRDRDRGRDKNRGRDKGRDRDRDTRVKGQRQSGRRVFLLVCFCAFLVCLFVSVSAHLYITFVLLSVISLLCIKPPISTLIYVFNPLFLY
jgi:1,4-dihydroxy-2-naphthoate octaprenyltransferase